MAGAVTKGGDFIDEKEANDEKDAVVVGQRMEHTVDVLVIQVSDVDRITGIDPSPTHLDELFRGDQDQRA